VATRVLVVLVAAGVVAGGGIFYLSYQKSKTCTTWRKSVEAVADSSIYLHGLPDGTTREELIKQMERASVQRPKGC
jgi:hypothetical protein